MTTTAPAAITTNSPFLVSDTETYSTDILGPVWFKMSNLQVAGINTNPASPVQVKYIIASDEQFSVSVDIEFNKTPLSQLLMCLGTKIEVDFAFEGLGKQAVELDLSAGLVTEKDVYKYTVTYTSTPDKVGMTTGLYQIAAVADIGPVVNQCKTPVFGHGFIAEILLEVYPKGEELP